MENNDLVEQRKAELLSYVQNFYRRSWDWRNTRFHERWDRCDRNYHSIYDPAKLAQKEPWQSTMFIDITMQNVEIIASQIYKIMMAPHPPIQTEAGPAGDTLQAKLIEEVMTYEIDKSSFNLAFYDANKESVRYGSGFIKLFWEKVVDTRMRRTPIEQSPQDVLQGAPMESLTGQSPMPQPQLMGFQMQPQEVLLKDQLCAKCVHIRDVFPEPNTTTWDKVIHRDKVDYGTIVRHIQRGEFFDVRDKLEDVSEGDKFEQDINDIRQERGYYDTNRQMAKFEKRHTIWEMWNAIPRKWIQFDMPEGDEAEELVPAKVMVASGVALLLSEENKQFDGESPILKDDYIRTGESYGKGICEMLFDDQDEMNEHANLGIDNMNMIMNKGCVILENALVNPEQDMVAKPGWQVRMKQQVVDDVRKGFSPIEWPDLGQSYFRHRFDLERNVQEKTGANRVTLGSSGAVKDTNQTLGGMELLRQMFNERVAAYGMVKESAFLMKAAQKIYGLIYQNLTPEGIRPILGEEPVVISEIPNPMTGMMMPVQVPRFLAFAFVPPEEINRSYRFKPMGVFSMENKITKTAQFMDWTKIFGPVVNLPEAAKYAAELLGIEGAEKLVMPFPMLPPPPPGGPSKKDTPGAKGGPNGNQPSFLPPNPVRREPVV